MSDTNSTANPKPNGAMTDFAERVRVNQKKLASELKPRYDFIVCGSGSSGSVVARRPDRGIAMAMRDADLAAEAKKNGGDGILLKAEQTDFLGTYSTGNAVNRQTLTLCVPCSAKRTSKIPRLLN